MTISSTKTKIGLRATKVMDCERLLWFSYNSVFVTYLNISNIPQVCFALSSRIPDKLPYPFIFMHPPASSILRRHFDPWRRYHYFGPKHLQRITQRRVFFMSQKHGQAICNAMKSQTRINISCTQIRVYQLWNDNNMHPACSFSCTVDHVLPPYTCTLNATYIR